MNVNPIVIAALASLARVEVPADRQQAHEQYLAAMAKAEGVEPLAWTPRPAAPRR